ncbi:MAG: YceI family protein [Cyclobacteriaceae bacterium]
MKTISTLSFMILGIFGLFMTQCTHDDLEALPEGFNPNPVERGDDIVLFDNGWSFDKTHSSVRWETAYLGTAALLTGRFNEFEIEVEFDEANPENIYVMGKVSLSTVNTGEPGRDAGCLLSTFGAEGGEPFIADEAMFESKSVVFDESDPNGYVITGDFTFHGVTEEVIMKLTYFGTDLLDLRGTPTNVAGFEGQFEINAKTVFGIESSSISDRVVININGQFRQPQ